MEMVTLNKYLVGEPLELRRALSMILQRIAETSVSVDESDYWPSSTRLNASQRPLKTQPQRRT
jgi:hypothetical protein